MQWPEVRCVAGAYFIVEYQPGLIFHLDVTLICGDNGLTRKTARKVHMLHIWPVLPDT